MRTAMMKKLHILILSLLAGALAYLAADCQQTEDNTERQRFAESSGEIFQIREYDNSSERYIDWNSPGLSASGTEFFTERSQQTGGTMRGQNPLKIPHRDSCWLKAGKIFSERMLHEFECPLRLFPSGTKSKDHHFIILRKLVI